MGIVTPLLPAFAIGIDPGPTTGIVLLHLTGGRRSDARHIRADIYQCNAGAAGWLLHQLLGRAGTAGAPARAGMEAFAPGRGAGARMKAGQVTRGQVEELAGICAEHGVPVAARNAGLVKPWATDRRLEACGLLALTPGSTHARDGARHALYCAVQDCGYPDPLSRAGQAAGRRPATGARLMSMTTAVTDENREHCHARYDPAPGSG